MSWLDYAFIAVVVLSALIGVARGLVREVLSLAVWIAAVLVAWLYHKEVAELLTPHIAEPSVRVAAAFGLLVLGVLILGSIVGWLLTWLIDKARLSWADRTLGLAFGAARGAVLVALAVYLAGLTPLPNEGWWKESQTVAGFHDLAGWLLSLVPPEVQAQLKRV